MQWWFCCDKIPGKCDGQEESPSARRGGTGHIGLVDALKWLDDNNNNKLV